MAALQASSATGSSVMLKVSGEYSSTHSVSGMRVGELLDQPHLLRDELHHLRHAHAEHHAAPHRRRGVVHVHDGAPRAAQRLSTVRRISSSRACVSTMSVTSSGTSFCSMRSRTVWKSVSDADGNPTSISLRPTRAQRLEQPLLGLAAHGLEQRLVAVAQIRAAPHRHRSQLARGPLPVRQVDGAEMGGISWKDLSAWLLHSCGSRTRLLRVGCGVVGVPVLLAPTGGACVFAARPQEAGANEAAPALRRGTGGRCPAVRCDSWCRKLARMGARPSTSRSKVLGRLEQDTISAFSGRLRVPPDADAIARHSMGRPARRRRHCRRTRLGAMALRQQFSSAAKSSGLTRCPSKPACFVRSRSSCWP